MASVVPNDTERYRSDLYTRPGWVDAVVALAQLDQVRCSGDLNCTPRVYQSQYNKIEKSVPVESGVIDHPEADLIAV